jgi:primase-polymerase (primpol)-like protein
MVSECSYTLPKKENYFPLENIPEELKEKEQWVMCKLEQKPGSDKMSKIPYAVDNKRAKSTDPDTWTHFDICFKAFKTRGYDGLGFVFSNDDEYIGIDWDNVRDPETGEIDPEVLQEIRSLGSYAEISQSGTGVHVICKGTKPGLSCRSGCREMYSKDRFFMMTGNHLAGTPSTVNAAPQEAIKAIYDKIDPPREILNNRRELSSKDSSVKMSDEQIISLCRNAGNANKFESLWNGDITAYSGDESRADQALCDIIAFYTQDPEQIDRIFRLSKLDRLKWERKDYASRTIQKAINGLTATYRPRYLSTSRGDEQQKVETISLLDIYPDDILERAHEILEYGNPLVFILDTWNKYHVGDRIIGKICACSVAATYLKNSSGIHCKPSGGSGTGKSDGLDNFSFIIPRHKVYRGSMSGMAAYYNDDIKPGTVFILDDTNLNKNEVLRDTIKRATSYFQRPTYHLTVNKQTPKKVKIPERCAWWLSSVEGFDDDQIANRFIGLDTEDSDIQDAKVYEQQVEHFMYGTSPDEDDDVLVCKAMFDILGQELYTIRVPFLNCVSWTNKDNRRNFKMFNTILMSVTFYHIKQREKVSDFYLSTVEDFEIAKEIYTEIAESNATNLTAEELDLLKWIVGKDWVDRQAVFKWLNINGRKASDWKVRALLHGMDGNGGLLAKVPGFEYNKKYVKTDTGGCNKCFYRYAEMTNFCENVVELDYSRVDDAIKKYKERMTCGTCDGLEDFSSSLETRTIDIDNSRLEVNGIKEKEDNSRGDIHSTDEQDYPPAITCELTTSSQQQNIVINSGFGLENTTQVSIKSPQLIDCDPSEKNKYYFSLCKEWEKQNMQSITPSNWIAASLDIGKAHKVPPKGFHELEEAIKQYRDHVSSKLCVECGQGSADIRKINDVLVMLCHDCTKQQLSKQEQPPKGLEAFSSA